MIFFINNPLNKAFLQVTEAFDVQGKHGIGSTELEEKMGAGLYGWFDWPHSYMMAKIAILLILRN